MTNQEAMKLALEALEALIFNKPYNGRFGEVITAIEEALAKQEQHTISSRVNDVRVHIEHGKQHDEAMKLITAKQEQGEPRQEDYLSKAYRLANELRCHLAIAPAPQQRTWVGLTHEKRVSIICEDENRSLLEHCERIEAELKEKNA
jgi:hypothetical protein